VLVTMATLGAGRAVRVGAGLAVLAGFVVLVTPEPSVVRAAAMATIVLLSSSAGRPGRGVASLALASFCLLVADPWLSRATWNWLFRGEPRGAHLIVRHEAPLELLNREAWQRCVRRGQLPGRAACCEPVASAPASVP
jgi:hypothetical protein